MKENAKNCPNCNNEYPNNVLYKCVRCFTEYCSKCDNSNEGKVCPKCGMSARIVLDKK